MELVDGRLLRLFGFTKTLEELDEIDMGRLGRALAALSLADDHKEFFTPSKKPKDPRLKARVNELIWLAKHGE